MATLPLVSVIIPSYNHEKYVEEAVYSVLNQTYPNIQLIVIDDGSKDNSAAILKKLSAKHGFIFEVQQNQGLSATLNKGITKYAKGKYIAILASDDYWHKEKTQKQVAYMENNPQYGMCYTGVYEINGTKLVSRHNAYLEGWIFDKLFIVGCLPPAMTVLYKKQVFDVVGLFDENLIIEDYDFFLRVAEKFPIGSIAERLACYRIHNAGIHFNYDKMLQAALQILDKWQGFPLYPQAVTSLYRRYFMRLLCEGHKIKAIKLLPKSKIWKKMDRNFILFLILFFTPSMFYRTYCKFKYSMQKRKMVKDKLPN